MINLYKKIFIFIAITSKICLINAENLTSKFKLDNWKSYAIHFGAGFMGQTVLNQGIGTTKTLLNLPELTQKNTAILTATGSVAAALPLMFTLNAVALLGLNNVLDTIKGEIEAETKDRVAKKYDGQFIKTLPEEKRNEQDIKFRYDQAKAKSTSRHVAKAVANGSLLARVLVVGATALSMTGPQVIEHFWIDLSQENKDTPNLPLTTEEETLKILKELRAKSNSSPLASIMNISLEQMCFFAGQLTAAITPNTLGIRYWNKFKMWNQAKRYFPL